MKTNHQNNYVRLLIYPVQNKGKLGAFLDEENLNILVQIQLFKHVWNMVKVKN